MKDRSKITRPSRTGLDSFEFMLYRFFTLEDVTASIESAMFPGRIRKLQPSRQILAHALNLGVWEVLDYDFECQTASNAVLLRHFEQVAAAASNLLGLLDERNNPILLVEPNSDYQRKILGHGFTNLQVVAANSLPETWIPENWVSTKGDIPGLPRDWLLENLYRAPDVIAIVQLLATHGAAKAKSSKSKPGRKPDTSSDCLFNLLACTFYATFGIQPDLGIEKTQPNSGSLLWVKEVIARLDANAAILRNSIKKENKGSAETDIETYTSLLTRTHALADVTKAGYLADGWGRWIKLPEPDRWKERLWWPDGTRRSSASVVPKWLAGAAISTPEEAGH